MAQFLQQNLLWIVLIGAILAIRFGGRRDGVQSGHGGATPGGCGGGHAAHGNPGHEERQDPESAAPGRAPSDPSGTEPQLPSVRDASPNPPGEGRALFRRCAGVRCADVRPGGVLPDLAGPHR